MTHRVNQLSKAPGADEIAAKVGGCGHPRGRQLLTRRLGQAEDLAHVITYLVSPLSHQVTGAEWSVDGGIQRQV
jgi:NAD(P)-dependent dehydrogenase (short-subunit alcohol dehydrogenase family)